MGATARQKRREQDLAAHRLQKATECTPTQGRKKTQLARKSSLLSFRPDTRSPQPMTLRDQAIYTGQHDHWTPGTRLRHNQVNFVKSMAVLASNEEAEEGTHTSPLVITPDTHEKGALLSSSLRKDHLEEDGSGDSGLFIIDATSPVRTGPPDPMIRSTSPTPSNSSEEVIVFKGRNTIRSQDETKIEASVGPVPAASTEKSVAHASLLTAQSFPLRPRDVSLSRPDQHDGPISVSRSHDRPKQGYPGEDEASDVDDEVAADYMANVKEYDSSEEDPESYFKPIPNNPSQSSGFAWSSDDLRDLGDLSTSSEMVTSVGRIYSKRKRPTGVQYLVVGKGLTPDDARWIQSELLTSVEAVEQIRVFEKNENQIPIYQDKSDSSSPSDLEGVKDQTFSDEDQDIFERVTEAMTDEQMAARLAKQEELGLDSDKVMLFNGDDDLGGVESTQDGVEETFIFKSQYNLRSSQKRASKGFPNATAFADSLTGGDPYGDFDILDRDRPSLTTKARKKLAKVELELSDTELEANLKSAWAKDREKKKSKKQEREDQRLMGLLGRGSDKRAREEYLKGPPLTEIKVEIRDFCMSNLESLPLPPLPNSYRMMVHHMCHNLGLRSVSQGVEPDRFMTVFKTQDTRPDELRIDRILRQYPQRAWQGKSKPGTFKREAPGGSRGNSGRPGTAAASYRDGDVVGAAAPEIGHDNKGRAMLEKMGWRSGTALGSENNKGIMLPVPHIVKNSKAGLG